MPELFRPGNPDAGPDLLQLKCAREGCGHEKFFALPALCRIAARNGAEPDDLQLVVTAVFQCGECRETVSRAQLDNIASNARVIKCLGCGSEIWEKQVVGALRANPKLKSGDVNRVQFVGIGDRYICQKCSRELSGKAIRAFIDQEPTK